MTNVKALSVGEVEARMKDIPGWELKDGKLRREFEFAGFVEAFGFMASAALAAESMNHHPQWSNMYKRVIVDLVTHEAGGITERDIQLALRMNGLTEQR